MVKEQRLRFCRECPHSSVIHVNKTTDKLICELGIFEGLKPMESICPSSKVPFYIK